MVSEPITVPRMPVPVYLVTAADQPGSAEPRETLLQEHLAYVEQNIHHYIACGPIHGDRGFGGSFFLLKGEDQQAIEAVIRNDPYALSGRVYQSMEFRQVTIAAGSSIGGVIWDITSN